VIDPEATPAPRRALLSGWGRAAFTSCELIEVDAEHLAAAIKELPARGGIARGLGRSYGDPAQCAGGRVLRLVPSGDEITIDPAAGTATVGAGVSIDELLRVLVPRGWFVPVTPGTRFVTIGGAVASDIHGKNHQRDGSFGSHVTAIRMMLADTTIVEVGPGRDPDLFWATAGGMGLTGVVLDATVAMTPIETSRAVVDTDRAEDLETCMALLAEGDERHEYTVAWIDLLPARGRVGRSVVTRGRFARRDELPSALRRDPLGFAPESLGTLPPLIPVNLMTDRRIRLFNEAWYRRAPRSRRGEIQSISRFFHPLDGIEHWNRAFGPRGVIQWQILVPFGCEDVLTEVAESFAAAKVATLIGVLKRFGAANPGPLSFPMPGWTLSLDMPAGGPRTVALLDRLDRLVAEAGGRIYLTKDSRMDPALVPRMYPRLDEWRAVRARVDPDGVVASDLGRRLALI